MKEITTLWNNNQINNALEYLSDISENIPFWNSDFQNKSAIVNAELSPYRALRHSCLRIQNRLNALNEVYYSVKSNKIKIIRLERQIGRLEKDKPLDYDLDIEEKINEIQKIKSNEYSTNKLIKDAIQEINVLKPVLESIGKISREEFESKEKEVFTQKLKINNLDKTLISYNSDLYEKIISLQKISK